MITQNSICIVSVFVEKIFAIPVKKVPFSEARRDTTSSHSPLRVVCGVGQYTLNAPLLKGSPPSLISVNKESVFWRKDKF